MDSATAASALRLIDLALAEDLGEIGDITSLCFVPAGHRSRARVVARAPAVVAGIEVAREVFLKVDPEVKVEILAPDGTAVETGQTVLVAEGASRSLLTAERTALNFLQRLSGVATVTLEYVRRVEGTGVEILDTRKTTPGWRLLEKAAVKAGGGRNHRMGLHDAAMVKDNHLVAENRREALDAGIRAVREQFPEAFIELEADRLDQVGEFLEMEEVDVILLDNMSLDDLREAVAMRDERAPGVRLEASGGIDLDTVSGIAATGIDCISVGALTHSAPSMDFGLDFEALD